jgi:hypothetical protein
MAHGIRPYPAVLVAGNAMLLQQAAVLLLYWSGRCSAALAQWDMYGSSQMQLVTSHLSSRLVSSRPTSISQRCHYYSYEDIVVVATSR